MAHTFRWRHAGWLLRGGAVLAYPTEGVFGIGCDPRNADALRAVVRIKGRSADKGLILIAASEEQLRDWVQPLDGQRMARIRATWPGPVTWVMPARRGVNPLITGGRDTVAVRVTSHPGAAALCRAFGGALVSTSANLSGRRAARTRLRVVRALGERVDGIVPGRVGERRAASVIRDAMSDETIRGQSTR